MPKIISLIALLLSIPVAVSADLSVRETDRIQEAAAVLRDLHGVPDKDIPRDLWENARCVVVVPSLKKAAFIVGGEYGKGLMSCRQGGGWSSPVFMEIEKGSWGLQLGAESVDLVLLVMNDHGMDKLLSDKVSLGAGASIAAGPIGRHAQAATDAQLNAEILGYSRAQGLFAGIDLSGGVLRADEEDNRDLYGRDVQARRVLMEATPNSPASTKALMNALRHTDAKTHEAILPAVP